MKYILTTSLLIILLISCSKKLAPTTTEKKMGPNPYVEIDGTALSKKEFQSFDANSIALLNTFYGKEAIKKFGKKAKDGAIIASTENYARRNYESFFSSESEDYKNIISQYNDSEIQYILNDRILKEKDEGALALINRRLLISISIINSKDLSDKFQVMDKKIGVNIKAKPPKNLYRAKNIF
jgi:hypothetical protein